MPIKYQPEGMSQLYASLAYQTGAAKADAQLAEDARQDKLRMQEWERQEQLEQHREALKIRAEQRAVEWEFEKMEIRSRNDFELEELQHRAEATAEIEKRVQEKRKLEAQIRAIEDSPRLSPEEKERAIVQVQTKVPVYTSWQTGQRAEAGRTARAASAPTLKDLTGQTEGMIDFMKGYQEDKKKGLVRVPSRVGDTVVSATEGEKQQYAMYQRLVKQKQLQLASLSMGVPQGASPDSVMYAKNDAGVVLKSYDGGKTWVK